MSHSNLRDLTQLLEIQGVKQGSPLWNFKMLEGRVEGCKEWRGMPTCDDCPQYDDCSLAKEYRIQLLYNKLE